MAIIKFPSTESNMTGSVCKFSSWKNEHADKVMQPVQITQLFKCMRMQNVYNVAQNLQPVHFSSRCWLLILDESFWEIYQQ